MFAMDCYEFLSQFQAAPQMTTGVVLHTKLIPVNLNAAKLIFTTNINKP